MPLYRHFEPLLILAITPFYTLHFYKSKILFPYTRKHLVRGDANAPPLTPLSGAKQSFVLAKNCYRMSPLCDAQKNFWYKKTTTKNSKWNFLEVDFLFFCKFFCSKVPGMTAKKFAIRIMQQRKNNFFGQIVKFKLNILVDRKTHKGL